jgi:hypothetical protein
MITIGPTVDESTANGVSDDACVYIAIAHWAAGVRREQPSEL